MSGRVADGPTTEDGKVHRCAGCGNDEEFKAFVLYTHVLQIDGTGDAWDDDLGSNCIEAEQERIECGRCGRSWRVDGWGEGGPVPAGEARILLGALEAARGVLEDVAYKAVDRDVACGDAADYWEEGRRGAALSAVLKAEALLGGRLGPSAEPSGEPDGEGGEES